MIYKLEEKMNNPDYTNLLNQYYLLLFFYIFEGWIVHIMTFALKSYNAGVFYMFPILGFVIFFCFQQKAIRTLREFHIYSVCVEKFNDLHEFINVWNIYRMVITIPCSCIFIGAMYMFDGPNNFNKVYERYQSKIVYLMIIMIDGILAMILNIFFSLQKKYIESVSVTEEYEKDEMMIINIEG